MAKQTYTAHGVYLMGQLYSKDGKPCSGARYFPLPYESVLLPESEWIAEKTYVELDSRVTKVKSVHPLAFSDKNGKLTFFHEAQEDIPKGESTKLSGGPVALKHSLDGKDTKRNVLFFPSYLVPMFTAGVEEGEHWIPKLHEKLKGLQEQDKYFTTEIKTLDPVSQRHLLLALPEGKELTALKESSPYFEHYHHWLSSLGREQLAGKPLHILTVPQYYTIVVSFSSAKYRGATVTLSELPPGLVVAGTEGQNISKVDNSPFKSVQNPEEDEAHFCATFWIESDILPTLHTLDEYCRIDINTETVDFKFVNEFKRKGLLTYSLKERVLHLPVKTVIGRSSLVNGDPISVEEALFSHVPDYYRDMTERLNKLPNERPEQEATSKANELPISAGMWHQFQSYKGFFEAGSGALEKGPTWQIMSKLAHASLSEVLASDDEMYARTTLAAAGVTGAAMGFIDAVADLEYNNRAVNRAALIQGALGRRAFTGIPFPDSVKPFLTGAGKVGNKVLGEPLTALEMVYSLSQTNKSGKHAVKAENAFLNDVTGYAATTISPSEDKLQALKKDADAMQAKEKEAIEALKGRWLI